MVNTSTNNDQQNPVIVELPGGKWITFWASEPTDAGVSAGLTYDIRGRVFGADGNAIGSEFVVPYTENTQIRPSGQGLEEWEGTDGPYTRNDELYNPYSGVFDVVALEGVNSGRFALVYPSGWLPAVPPLMQAYSPSIQQTGATQPASHHWKGDGILFRLRRIVVR